MDDYDLKNSGDLEIIDEYQNSQSEAEKKVEPFVVRSEEEQQLIDLNALVTSLCIYKNSFLELVINI